MLLERKETVLTERPEENGKSSAMGKCLDSNAGNRTRPTIPVAPTMPTRRPLVLMRLI